MGNNIVCKTFSEIDLNDPFLNRYERIILDLMSGLKAKVIRRLLYSMKMEK